MKTKLKKKDKGKRRLILKKIVSNETYRFLFLGQINFLLFVSIFVFWLRWKTMNGLSFCFVCKQNTEKLKDKKCMKRTSPFATFFPIKLWYAVTRQ